MSDKHNKPIKIMNLITPDKFEDALESIRWGLLYQGCGIWIIINDMHEETAWEIFVRDNTDWNDVILSEVITRADTVFGSSFKGVLRYKIEKIKIYNKRVDLISGDSFMSFYNFSNK